MRRLAAPRLAALVRSVRRRRGHHSALVCFKITTYAASGVAPAARWRRWYAPPLWAELSSSSLILLQFRLKLSSFLCYRKGPRRAL